MKRQPPKNPGNLHMFDDPVQLAMLEEFRDLTVKIISEAEERYRAKQAARPLKGQISLAEERFPHA